MTIFDWLSSEDDGEEIPNDILFEIDLITCENCGEIYIESELPYINGMYDYTCPNCGFVN